ncbi:hypothetical protein K7X08_013366 [Anisodus acutangulus]|uniref:Uncharacterized protein n=2 Tax=Anisodus TaxID=243963 RepID=A0A9Q1MEP9_9SOLA|nr:hypothetical protein K7X08_013366 [Anisodus acutangulus]KAK4365489.1 hypothetical protein RND71_016847 [Anisodus tanguticus]
MGNCVKACLQRKNIEELRVQEEKTEEKTGKFIKENIEMEKGKTNMRLKIVLTKEELEWLLLQLKFQEGKKLEEFLGEIERNRGNISCGWRPSLESITESPEVPEMMDR